MPSRKLTAVLQRMGRAKSPGSETRREHRHLSPPLTGATPGLRVSLGVASDQKMLLYVGRLAQEKNTDTLFKAFDCS